MQRLGQVSALDGLRGIAILLVLACHFTGEPFGGAYGVDLFFVLSGFLITALLLEERAAAGRIRLGGFYVRRARRLLPALAAMLCCYLVYNTILGRDALGTVAEYGLYFGNVYFVVTHQPDATGLGHLWSLAEEEQFYLLWPLLLLLVVRAKRPLYWVAALAVALIVYRFALILGGASMHRLYRAPDTHSEGLVLGAALAFLRQQGFVAGEWAGKLGLALTIPAVVAGVWNFGLPVFELGALLLVAAAVSDTSLAKAFSLRPLVWIGALSYSLYLWHFPVLWAFHDHNRVLALGISFMLAWLSYRYIEQPFRRRRSASFEPTVSPSAASAPL